MCVYPFAPAQKIETIRLGTFRRVSCKRKAGGVTRKIAARRGMGLNYGSGRGSLRKMQPRFSRHHLLPAFSLVKWTEFPARIMEQLGDVELQSLDLSQYHDTPDVSAAHAPRENPIATTESRRSFHDVPMWEQEKEGGKFFGCCCDYRRAVIVISAILLIFNGFSACFTIDAMKYCSDSNNASSCEEIGLSTRQTHAVGLLVSAAASIAALIGALKFIFRLVALKVVESIGKCR